MALKGWSQPATTFDLPGGGSVSVRGLSVDMVAALVRQDREALESLFQQVTQRPGAREAAEKLQKGEEVDPPTEDLDTGDVVAAALEHAPGLCAKVIAWAAGEPEAEKEARDLPFPTQFDILVEIGRLTFEVTPMGKFLEAVVALARNANTGMQAARTMR